MHLYQKYNALPTALAERINRKPKQRRRRRLQKRHLKSEFAPLQILSRLFHRVKFVKCWRTQLEWRDRIEVQEKKTKIVVLHSRYPQNGEIYSQFHVEVVQRRQRNV